MAGDCVFGNTAAGGGMANFEKILSTFRRCNQDPAYLTSALRNNPVAGVYYNSNLEEVAWYG